MKFFVIGHEHTVAGFGLVGIEGKRATDRNQAKEALDYAVARKDIGVVLITEDIAEVIRDEVEARLYGIGFPLVLEIPGPKGPLPKRLKVEEVVRKAIGISI